MADATQPAAGAAGAVPAWQRTAALREQRLARPWGSALLLPREPRIGDGGLRALEVHKYRAGPVTPLDRVLYIVWWEPVASMLPMWLAPNVITLLGAAAAIASGALLWASSPSLDGEVPAWVEILAGSLVLFYQTCDAIDGLQARRTGASSPLGELLDHGCDAACLTSFTIGYCASLQCGFGPLTFSALVVSWFPWWTAQWEAYHTGVVRTGGALFGITEIECVVALIHFISAVAGPQVWRTPILALPTVLPGDGVFDLREVCVCIQLVVAGVLSVLSVRNVLLVCAGRSEVLTAFRRALPLVILVGVTFLWPVTLPGLHSGALCLAVSGLFTRIASEIVLCHMTLEEYPKYQPTVAALPAFYILALLNALGNVFGSVVFGAYAFYCLADAIWYAVDVIEEVTTHMGVPLFAIAKKS